MFGLTVLFLCRFFLFRSQMFSELAFLFFLQRSPAHTLPFCFFLSFFSILSSQLSLSQTLFCFLIFLPFFRSRALGRFRQFTLSFFLFLFALSNSGFLFLIAEFAVLAYAFSFLSSNRSLTLPHSLFILVHSRSFNRHSVELVPFNSPEYWTLYNNKQGFTQFVYFSVQNERVKTGQIKRLANSLRT